MAKDETRGGLDVAHGQRAVIVRRKTRRSRDRHADPGFAPLSERDSDVAARAARAAAPPPRTRLSAARQGEEPHHVDLRLPHDARFVLPRPVHEVFGARRLAVRGVTMSSGARKKLPSTVVAHVEDVVDLLVRCPRSTRRASVMRLAPPPGSSGRRAPSVGDATRAGRAAQRTPPRAWRARCRPAIGAQRNADGARKKLRCTCASTSRIGTSSRLRPSVSRLHSWQPDQLSRTASRWPVVASTSSIILASAKELVGAAWAGEP